MPFKESKEGQTHYYNDGCGCPEHNNIKINSYTITFTGKRYEQLERLCVKRKSKLYVITKALDLLEKAKNI